MNASCAALKDDKGRGEMRTASVTSTFDMPACLACVASLALDAVVRGT
jgi:hypothetical protein